MRGWGHCYSKYIGGIDKTWRRYRNVYRSPTMPNTHKIEAWMFRRGQLLESAYTEGNSHLCRCLPSKENIQLARKRREKAECVSPAPCIKKNVNGETSEAIYHASQCRTTKEPNLVHPGACKISSMRRSKANTFLIEQGIQAHRRRQK